MEYKTDDEQRLWNYKIAVEEDVKQKENEMKQSLLCCLP